MGLFRRREQRDNATPPPSPSEEGYVSAGVRISHDTAMRHSAVWACVRILSETIASLPVDLVVVRDDVRDKRDLPAWLNKPNPSMNRFQFIEALMSSMVLTGNAYAALVRDEMTGGVHEAHPLHPDSVLPRWDARGHAVVYDVTARGGTGPIKQTVSADDMLHIPAFKLPGSVEGISPIEQLRLVLSAAQATDQYAATYFGNSTIVPGVIEVPQGTTVEQTREMARGWQRAHQGAGNAWKPGFLTGGATWKPLTVTNEESQFIESRKFSVGDIARIFRVPPHKIGDLERATFSNIEHQAIEFVTDAIAPWVARLEAALSPLVLPQKAQVKFNLNGLLRGDAESRFRAYATGRQWGWLSVDDIRALEDLNPVPDGGDVYLQPMNMVPLGTEPTQPELSLNGSAPSLNGVGGSK